MEILTGAVYPGEPCYGYMTGPRQLPSIDGGRMVEFVFVIRGDAIAKYVQDFGAYDDWPFYIPPMIVPSDGENTVAQLQDMGERHRHDDKWDRRMREYKEGSTLFQDIIRQEEQRHEIIQNRSTFGPAGNFQRNGWPHEHVVRRWMDERARRTGKRQFSV